jgi:hypothetical protein
LAHVDIAHGRPVVEAERLRQPDMLAGWTPALTAIVRIDSTAASCGRSRT